MKLYHTAGSPPSRSVLMTIRCLNLDVEIQHISLLKGDHLKEEFARINPLKQVPTFVDSVDGQDFVLTESRAIQAYLVNAKAPGDSLYPNDPVARAVVDQRLYFDATTVFGTLKASLGPIFFGGATEVSDDNRDKLKQAFKHLDSFLQGKQYFAGDRPTIADISILSNIIQAKNAFVSIGNHPNLDAWYKRCSETLAGFEENLNGGKVVQEAFKAKGIKLASLE